MTDRQHWFAAQSAGAPPVLRDRAAMYFARRPAAEGRATALAAAAADALSTSLGHTPGRDAALDLLAADALVTLALKACAADDPASLGSFAAGLRAAGFANR